MRTQLNTWLEGMLNGSSQPPRQCSDDPQTARIHLMGIAPIISKRGRTPGTDPWPRSPPNKSAPHSRRAVPGGTGQNTGYAPCSESSKPTNSPSPTPPVRYAPRRSTPPSLCPSTPHMPLYTAAIRQALGSPDPAVAFAVALVAFHALIARWLAGLKLTNIVDGRLALDGRGIPLAGPVRARTQPATIDPHLSINKAAAPGAHPSGNSSPGETPTSGPKPCEETGSSNRSTPPAATSDGSATCSGPASGPPCATRPPRTATTPNANPTDCRLSYLTYYRLTA